LTPSAAPEETKVEEPNAKIAADEDMMVDVDEQTGTVFMYPKVMENYAP
jgi:hypothetical protein